MTTVAATERSPQKTVVVQLAAAAASTRRPIYQQAARRGGHDPLDLRRRRPVQHPRRGRRLGGAGLRLRDLQRRRDRHQRPRGHRRRQRRRRHRSTRRRRSTSSSPTATRSPADIVGFDPNADVALLKVDPQRPRPAPAPARRPTSRSQVGEPVAAIGSPFGEDQSLSVGVVSATDRSIESLTNFQIDGRDPDRRLDQPGQLRRPAARRRRPRDRDQPADQHRPRAATRGSASRSRSTSCRTRSTSSAPGRQGQVRRTSGSPPSRSIRSSPTSSASRPTPARWSRRWSPAARPTTPGSRARTRQIRFQGQQVNAGGDVIIAVDGHKIVNETDLPQLIAQLQPGRHGDARDHPRRPDARTST